MFWIKFAMHNIAMQRWIYYSVFKFWEGYFVKIYGSALKNHFIPPALFLGIQVALED